MSWGKSWGKSWGTAWGYILQIYSNAPSKFVYRVLPFNIINLVRYITYSTFSGNTSYTTTVARLSYYKLVSCSVYRSTVNNKDYIHKIPMEIINDTI